MRAYTLALAALLTACTGSDNGLGALGGGTHDPSNITVETIATAAHGLSSPSDIAVNPRAPGELWITNYGDNSMVRITDGAAERLQSMGSEHFLASPSSLAFSDFGNFATSQDTDDITQAFTPADFMGPTLWDDSAMFDAGHLGHLDMLHNSPNGGGIAWESGNAYWVVDGFHGSLTRYDFVEDHDYGGSDHSDGVIHRYAEGSIYHTKGIPNHADMVDGVLYVANGSVIASFDPSSATRGGAIGPDYDGAEMARFSGGDLQTLVSGAVSPMLDEGGEPSVLGFTLQQPSGLEVHDGLIYGIDRPQGIVFVLTLDGEVIDWLPTGRPDTLSGIDVHPETGTIYVVDMGANEVLAFSEG